MELSNKSYVNGPFLKVDTILYRQYQQNIINRCQNKNSLVILPTGLGKTIIGILLIARSLQKYHYGKILILAPTRPLISQHVASCRKFLMIHENAITALTGRNKPDHRILLFNTSRIIVSTPQVIKNDLERGRYNLGQVSLIIFDEAHRTKGNYSYNFISNEYVQGCSDPMLLGLTASPGKDFNNIQQICDNLFIENVISKSHNDGDVIEYFYDIDIIIEKVNLNARILELREIWSNLFEILLTFFINKGIINPSKKYFSKLSFLDIIRDISLSLKQENGNEIIITEEELREKLVYKDPKLIDIIKEKNINIHTIFSFCASCISLLHAKELLETQDISLFKSFLDKIFNKSEHQVKSAERIAKTEHFKLIYSIIENKTLLELAHPKINKIKTILNQELKLHDNKKIIIFTQYREMAEILKNRLSKEFNGRVTFEKFIGQSTHMNDIGFSQMKQYEILELFRNGKINVLIATSVAEEGLDIPNVDAIIFYEPIPSEIRTIQRRGRTGRFSYGRCYVLITEGTVDEMYYNVALKKENTMRQILQSPENLLLCDGLSRKKIDFPQKTRFNECLGQDHKVRRIKEKEHVINRSIEEVINELDNFKNSKEYIALKSNGITLYSDLFDSNQETIKKKIMKMRKTYIIFPEDTTKKQYLNKNLKTLVNIVETYSERGILDYSVLQQRAEEEEIIDKKFFIHFNQACNLGYIKKLGSKVHFIKSIKD